MHKALLNVLGLASLAVVLVGCESSPSDKDSQNVNVATAPAPGTPGDFKANIKDRVYFDYNKSTVSTDAKKILEAQAGWLKTYASTKLTVEGHCDARGTREYNLALGEKRAHAASHALTKMGVEKGRIKTMSYGKDKMPVPNAATEAEHALNRAAVTVVE